jgi:hypothetical protein
MAVFATGADMTHTSGQSRPRKRGGVGGTIVMLVVTLALTAGVLGGGIWLLVQRETGTRTQAHVGSCTLGGTVKSRTVDCQGSWTVGGSLADGGHVVVGTIQGVDQGDVGKTVDVTIRNGTAYSRGVALPIVLIVLGLLPAAVLYFVVRGLFRRS